MFRLNVSWKLFTKCNWDKSHNSGRCTRVLAVLVSRTAGEAQQVSASRWKKREVMTFVFSEGKEDWKPCNR